MDLPADVRITHEPLGLKNTKGTLVAVSKNGFFELRLTFSQRQHKVLVPIPATSIIFSEPEPEFASEIEIER